MSRDWSQKNGRATKRGQFNREETPEGIVTLALDFGCANEYGTFPGVANKCPDNASILGALTKDKAINASNQLHRHRCGLSAAYAERGQSTLAAPRLQRREQGRQDARARRADGMAKGAGAAVDI